MTLVEAAVVVGNLGEFVGAIAVVVTLACLARQVRQNSQLIRSQIENNT